MDDKIRFDQLEEIIVGLLRKQDRTIEEIGQLREAIVSQQLLLTRMQNDLNRLEAEQTSTRRQVNDLAKLVQRGFEEFSIALARHERLLQETAVILAKHELFHQEVRDFQQEMRNFQQETRGELAYLRQDVTDLKQEFVGMRSTLDHIVTLLTKP